MVIPTTTLMYSLPISVMIAMVIMRGSIIIITRMVDSILHWQKLSNKKILWEENLAVGISLLAVSHYMFFAQSSDFDFIRSTAATTILGIYISSYAIRIYIMNVFKFTRDKEHTSNNTNYFAIEQLTASVWIFGFAGFVLLAPGKLLSSSENFGGFFEIFYTTMRDPHPNWMGAAICGTAFGISAFFSAFLFMFEGRSSTFSGLVNRLSSLLAGTCSTLLFAFLFGGKYPKLADWGSFALIILAVYFLGKAEKRRLKA